MTKLNEKTWIPLGAAIATAPIFVGAIFFMATLMKDSEAHGRNLTGFKEEMNQRLLVNESTIRTNNEICTKSVVSIEKAIIKMQADIDYIKERLPKRWP